MPRILPLRFRGELLASPLAVHFGVNPFASPLVHVHLDVGTRERRDEPLATENSRKMIEVKADAFALKNLATGEQVTVARGDLAAWFRSALG